MFAKVVDVGIGVTCGSVKVGKVVGLTVIILIFELSLGIISPLVMWIETLAGSTPGCCLTKAFALASFIPFKLFCIAFSSDVGKLVLRHADCRDSD